MTYYAAEYPSGIHARYIGSGLPVRRVHGFDSYKDRDAWVDRSPVYSPRANGYRKGLLSREIAAAERYQIRLVEDFAPFED